jgi:hypothetical protein
VIRGVGQNVGQTQRYGIARLVVRQLLKLTSIQYRSCTTERSGPGDRFEPTTSAMPVDLDIPVALYRNSFYTTIFDVYQDRRLRHNFNAQ